MLFQSTPCALLKLLTIDGVETKALGNENGFERGFVNFPRAKLRLNNWSDMFLFCEVVYAFGKPVWSAILFRVTRAQRSRHIF